MTTRWQGGSALLAISVSALLLAGTVAADAPARSALQLTLPDGTTLATVPLPPDGSFALRYRNSLYGTLAEERFVLTDGGELRLVELAAEQLAVLEEYYAITDPARPAHQGDGWTATPAHVPVITQLRVAATDLGERTLLVHGHTPIELWRFVEDHDPSVLLEAAP
jgi:hypothetical protein